MLCFSVFLTHMNVQHSRLRLLDYGTLHKTRTDNWIFRRIWNLNQIEIQREITFRCSQRYFQPVQFKAQQVTGRNEVIRAIEEAAMMRLKKVQESYKLFYWDWTLITIFDAFHMKRWKSDIQIKFISSFMWIMSKTKVNIVYKLQRRRKKDKPYWKPFRNVEYKTDIMKLEM